MCLHKQTAPNFSELLWCSVFALPGKGLKDLLFRMPPLAKQLCIARQLQIE